ncbi:MAG TPA: selenocysteine-specific translation elongation factor [Gemmatimonadaceae bacterium]|nr:selenocysteine-specific translation elongation factor [Gemmatimonadaceae bacterium]
MIVGTAGHIDHGKTALVRALTGVDTDRLPEEKRRGITIDLGFAPLSLEGVGTVGVVDVPGHEDFVRSMLVGATGVDVGLLVVSADEGIMPQTREHLLILDLLKIPRIVVALTKSDLVDPEWLALVRAEVEALFAGSIEPVTVVACSSRTGAGIGELRAALSEALRSVSPRAADDLFRLPVDRAFSIRGTGTVVTGTIWSGELRADATVRVLPGGKAARARRIELHGATAERAHAGGRAAIAVAGLDVGDVPRGSVLVTDEAWQATSVFEALVGLAADLTDRISPRTELRVHAGTSEVGARISFAEAESESDSPSLARITTDGPIVLRGGDRFVIRLPAPLRTIGGGVVLDPYARRRAMPVLSPDLLETLPLEPVTRFRFLLEAESTRGISIRDVPVRVGCAPADMSKLIETTKVHVGAHNLFPPQAVEQVMATVQRIVAEYEIKSPLSAGVPNRTLREGLHVDDELADITIREMERGGAIEARGPVLRRRGWVPSPSLIDIEISNRLAHDICAAGREPPSVGELVVRYGNSVPGLLHYLERQSRVVQVETERYYDRDAVEALIARLRGGLAPGRVYGPAQLKDILGFSRKYLIPFLEFCDRIGVTERREEGRTLRQGSVAPLDSFQAHP